MRAHTVVRLFAAALLAAGALTVAACGDDDGAGGANSAADSERGARDAQLKYARCMRENGVDMPDPTFDSEGRVYQTGRGEDVPPEKLREAEQACRKYLEEIEPLNLSEQEQHEFREAMLANSRCMREQGIENYPDPTFGEDGQASIEIPAGSGFDEENPEVKQAIEACEDTLPQEPSEESAR